MSSEDSEGFCLESATALDFASVLGVSVSVTAVLEGIWPVALDVTWVRVAGALSVEVLLSSGGVVWG